MMIESKGRKYGVPVIKDAIYNGVIVDCEIKEIPNKYNELQFQFVPHIEIDIEGKTILYRSGILYEGAENTNQFLSAALYDEDKDCTYIDSLLGKECKVELKRKKSAKGKTYIGIVNIEYPENVTTET